MIAWLKLHALAALLGGAAAYVIVRLCPPERAKLTKLFSPNDKSRPTDEASAATISKPLRSEPSGWFVAGISYFGIGYVLGGVAGVVTFVAAYIYCIATGGFLLGLGLGWLPSGILAAIVGWLTVVLWGPAIIVILASAMLLVLNIRYM